MTTQSCHLGQSQCLTNCDNPNAHEHQRHHQYLHTPGSTVSSQSHSCIIDTYSNCCRRVSDGSDVDKALAPFEPISFIRRLRSSKCTSTSTAPLTPDHTRPCMPSFAPGKLRQSINTYSKRCRPVSEVSNVDNALAPSEPISFHDRLYRSTSTSTFSGVPTTTNPTTYACHHSHQ